MRAVCVVRPHPEIRGWFHLFLTGHAKPRVACSEREADSTARHVVGRLGGSVWFLDSKGFPIVSETIAATGDTGLRCGGGPNSGQI